MSFALPRLGGLARGTLAVFGWNLARLATQLVWVVLMAWTLGVDGYGGFSGVAGLALAVSGLAGAGLGLRMYQDVARSPDLFPQRWAQASRALRWSALLLWLAFLALAPMAFAGLSLDVLALIALAELVGTPMVAQVAFAYSAHGRMASAAAAPVLMSLARVGAVMVLPRVADATDMQAYALLHAMATLGAAVVLWSWCRRQLAPGAADGAMDAGALREGLRLSSIWASGLALGSLDKAMALRAGGADVAGQYTAANRFASLLALPVDALVAAALPRLFRAGAGQSGHPRLLGLLVVATLAYGALAGAALWLGAGLLPRLLGADFAPAVPALAVLALYVPAYCMRSLGATVLLGYGWTHWRLAAELSALMLLVALMAVWAKDGAVGAAWAAVVTEWSLVLGLWGRVIAGAARREGFGA